MTPYTQIMERPEDAVGAEEGDKDIVEDVVTPMDEVGDVERMLPRDAAMEDNIVIPTGILRAQVRSVRPLEKHTKSTQLL